MIYTFKVKYFEEDTNKVLQRNGFLFADKYKEAIDTLTSYYGEYNTEEVTLGCFAPDNILAFGNEGKELELFCETRNIIGEQVVW